MFLLVVSPAFFRPRNMKSSTDTLAASMQGHPLMAKPADMLATQKSWRGLVSAAMHGYHRHQTHSCQHNHHHPQTVDVAHCTTKWKEPCSRGVYWRFAEGSICDIGHMAT